MRESLQTGNKHTKTGPSRYVPADSPYWEADDNVVLSAEHLTLHVRNRDGSASPAVEDVSFNVRRGEILGIVGESGCGKSLTVMAIMGLLKPDVKPTGGKIIFDGRDLLALTGKEREAINGRDLSIIYQEPMTSLNPLMKIGKQLGEAVSLHEKVSKEEIRKRTLDLLTEVGIQDAEACMKAYPHQLSGGMRQRVMIAMATICKPQILLADEPTTALDVTTQAHVLDLLKRINREYGTTILFISHDLGVINRICDRVIVMYAGRICEAGTTRAILQDPRHEYTRGLIRSIPTRDRKGEDLPCIPGRVPPVEEKKDPCPFAPRCGRAMDICRTSAPSVRGCGGGHIVYCHLYPVKGKGEKKGGIA